MVPEAKKPSLERINTDESLRSERDNADQAMSEQLSDREADADDVVERAREQADAVLDSAREKADQKLETALPGSQRRPSIIMERAREDEALEVERATADERLRLEREEQSRTLLALLPFERDETDRFLLTERARSDDALANRDDFLGMVSHDLRNLLSGIVLHAALLSGKASDTEEGKRTVFGMKRIQSYVARMNRLIGDLVDVVSIDAGKLAVLRERCDATALLIQAVELFELAASDKGVTLSQGAVERALLGDFDHDRMLQVLANLITNALKFTPSGGRITLRGTRGEGELRLSVSDTGQGIPAEALESVFERFWQVGKSDKRGLGLGLYISRCIVDAHGGKIWAESTLGAGSTFHVSIPAV